MIPQGPKEFSTRVAEELDRLAHSNYLRRRKEIAWRMKTVDLLKRSFLRSSALMGCTQFIELGAHDGEVSNDFTRAEGFFALAIEANPITFQDKLAISASQRTRILNLAVSDLDGDMELHIPTESGILSPGNASLLAPEGGGNTHSILVPARRLDSVLNVEERNRFSSLWIDVEGMALPVLKGAIDYLLDGKCKIILVEVEESQLWANQFTAQEVDSFLTSVGYSSIMRDAQTDEQYNVVYVRSENLDETKRIVEQYWAEVSCQKFTFREIFPYNSRDLLRIIKNQLLRSKLTAFSRLVNRAASLVGSKSSSASSAK